MPEVSEVFTRIEKNYGRLNQMMSEEVDIASSHGTTTGNYREEMWLKLFRNIIPLKYSIAQGVIIIDSEGKRSKEVDIAVYDEAYTPYVFQHNTLKFIPIEAVVVAIECKSSSSSTTALEEWAKDIRKLKPSASGIARIVSGYATGITNTTQRRSRPILIFASNHVLVKDESLEKKKNELGVYFDFIILKQGDSHSEQDRKRFEVLVKNEQKTLGWWGKRLNEAESLEEEQEIKNEALVVIPNAVKKEPQEPKELNEEDKKKAEHRIKELSKQFEELHFKLEEDRNAISITNTLKQLEIPNNSLLSLNLQLNQLLMLINNPMMFPHFAYARVFQDIVKS
ncbi:DUF6602 domain-containing protein [Saccharibacillus sacchari]|uniref:DUF6602 domain-containing protein n=1 Tax=Saccharibacillus sacchari TaxID=456493 RepID=A0ACC6PC21_9BACL